MYVILTSKPGQFRTELVDGLSPVESYDYLFYGRKRAHFVIAKMQGQPRVRVIDEVEPPVVNLVPSKFLPRFDTLEAARRELAHLTSFGSMSAQLARCADPVVR